jgi:quinol monooxygenase YgiN
VPYIHETSFTISPDQMDELQVGHSLGRTLAFLKAQLPNEHGFMTSRALYSVDDPATTRIVLLSEWGSWEALQRHHESELAESKALTEFEPHVRPADMTTRIYAEIGPKGY